MARIFPRPTANAPIPFAASVATIPPPAGSATANTIQQATITPSRAASEAPELECFHADFPTQTASRMTMTAAPATSLSSAPCKIQSREEPRTMTRRHAPLPALVLAALFTLTAAGCSSSSPPSCSDSSCATQEIQKSLIGIEAKDGAAITKTSCKAATLNPGGVWTASCAVTESDGLRFTGTGNWFTGTQRVTFEPTAAA